MKTMAEKLFKEFRERNISDFFRSAVMRSYGMGILSATPPQNQLNPLKK